MFSWNSLARDFKIKRRSRPDIWKATCVFAKDSDGTILCLTYQRFQVCLKKSAPEDPNEARSALANRTDIAVFIEVMSFTIPVHDLPCYTCFEF